MSANETKWFIEGRTVKGKRFERGPFDSYEAATTEAKALISRNTGKIAECVIAPRLVEVA